MREWFRRWLGIAQHESTATQAASVLAGKVSGLEEDLARVREKASLAEAAERMGELMAARGMAAEETRAALERHIGSLETALGALGVSLEKHLSEPNVVRDEVEFPAACPFCSHEGLVIAAVITRVDMKRPEVTEVVGYGLACAKCKKTHYGERDTAGKWRTRTIDAEEPTAPADDDEDPKPEPRRAEPHFRRVRR